MRGELTFIVMYLQFVPGNHWLAAGSPERLASFYALVTSPSNAKKCNLLVAVNVITDYIRIRLPLLLYSFVRWWNWSRFIYTEKKQRKTRVDLRLDLPELPWAVLVSLASHYLAASSCLLSVHLHTVQQQVTSPSISMITLRRVV